MTTGHCIPALRDLAGMDCAGRGNFLLTGSGAVVNMLLSAANCMFNCRQRFVQFARCGSATGVRHGRTAALGPADRQRSVIGAFSWSPIMAGSVPNLASRVLALRLRRLADDMLKRHEYPVHLAETFVDISRFSGVCYRASLTNAAIALIRLHGRYKSIAKANRYFANRSQEAHDAVINPSPS